MYTWSALCIYALKEVGRVVLKSEKAFTPEERCFHFFLGIHLVNLLLRSYIPLLRYDGGVLGWSSGFTTRQGVSSDISPGIYNKHNLGFCFTTMSWSYK